MFRLSRGNSFDDVFNFQREVDRLFNQFWSDLPTRTAPAGASPAFQVNATDDGWRVDVPLPGIDPKGVSLEVAGNNLTIRAEAPEETRDQNVFALRTDADDSAVPRYSETDRLAPAWHAAPDASIEGERQAAPDSDRDGG